MCVCVCVRKKVLPEHKIYTQARAAQQNSVHPITGRLRVQTLMMAQPYTWPRVKLAMLSGWDGWHTRSSRQSL